MTSFPVQYTTIQLILLALNSTGDRKLHISFQNKSNDSMPCFRVYQPQPSSNTPLTPQFKERLYSYSETCMVYIQTGESFFLTYIHVQQSQAYITLQHGNRIRDILATLQSTWNFGNKRFLLTFTVYKFKSRHGNKWYTRLHLE